MIDIYDRLYQRQGPSDFIRLFPVILTDNGSEFSNPKKIENGPEEKGFQRTQINYCNPSAPYQKAEIEVRHEFIQRQKLNRKSPYEAFSFYYGEELAQKLGCQKVAARDINLTPGLLKK